MSTIRTRYVRSHRMSPDNANFTTRTSRFHRNVQQYAQKPSGVIKSLCGTYVHYPDKICPFTQNVSGQGQFYNPNVVLSLGRATVRPEAVWSEKKLMQDVCPLSGQDMSFHTECLRTTSILQSERRAFTGTCNSTPRSRLE